jgi:hypothetical protein
MKNIMVFVAAFCFAMVGFSQKVMAGPVPVSAQEVAQLSGMAGDSALLAMKAGGSFPGAPVALAAREESSLRNLETGSPRLSKLKAGDDPGSVLTWVVVICVCVVLLRIVGVL